MASYTDDERQQTIDWFLKNTGNKQAYSLPKRLVKELGISLLTADCLLRDLHVEGVLVSSRHDHRHGMLRCTLEKPKKESEVRWQSVLEPYTDSQNLLPCHEVLADWQSGDLYRLHNALMALKVSLPETYNMTTYEASARYLMGSSKLLDSLPKKSLQQFGIDPDRFRKKTNYMVIAGSANPEQVILIENPESFEACIRADLHQTSGLVCTYGYGLQWKEAMEQQEVLLGLVRAGDPTLTLESLMRHPKLYFWGDLDHAGMDIYQKIQSRYSNCLLSNLYLPMIDHLNSGNGHSYSKLVEKEKQPDKVRILPVDRAVDQEAVSMEDIKRQYRGGLSFKDLLASL